MSEIMINKEDVLDMLEGDINGIIDVPQMSEYCKALQNIYFRVKSIEGVESVGANKKGGL